MRFLGLLLLYIAAAHADDAKLYLQSGHSEIHAVAFSPDSRFVLTASRDKTARLWDAKSGREIRRFDGHSNEIAAAIFSPDGRLILTGSADYSARLWDVATGAEIRRFEHKEAVLSNSVTAVAFSPDAQLLVTAGFDQAVHVWETATGRELRHFDGHTAFITSAAFSPDGRSILTGSSDHTARLWDAASGRELLRLEGHAGPVNAVAFSPDGRFLLTGSSDRTARLWDAATGRELRRLEGHTEPVASVAISPNNRTVLTGSFDTTARTWDLSTGAELHRFEPHASLVESVAFSPNGREIVIGCAGRTAVLWNAATGAEILRFEGRSDPVNAVAASRNGEIATAPQDGTARVWSSSNGREIARLPHDHPVSSVAFSPDGRLAITSSTNTGALWNLPSGERLHALQAHSGLVPGVAFSPTGQSVATASWDGTVRLWDVLSGRETQRFGPIDNIFTSVAFSPDGALVLTGSDDNIARLWDAAIGREVRRFEGHRFAIFSVAYSPNGRHILTGSGDHTAILWDATSGREIRRFIGHGNLVLAVAFSPDGKLVLTGSADKTARLWDAETGREISRLQGHSDEVTSVAFSSDGRFTLTASMDGSTGLWRTADGQLVATLVSFTDGSWAVVDPEGRYDASEPDHGEGLYWRVGDFGTIGLSQLRRSFYTPGLLASIFRGDPLPPVKGLNQIANLPPAVAASATAATLQVTLTDIAPSGYGHVTLRVNGRPFDAKRISQIKSGAGEVLQFDLTDAHLAEGDNTIAVTAASSDNLIESDPATTTFNQSAAARGVNRAPVAPSTKPTACAGHFYGIFVGTGTFPFAQTLNLRYPESDAQSLAEAVRLGAESLCGKDKVELITLTSNNPDPAHQPTKANIARAFQDIAAKSTRNDLLFVYLSGHGAAPTDDPHAYFYLTQEARQVNVDIADKLRETTTVSGAELVQWLTNPNLPDKQVLILDTCAAGAANTQLAALTIRARSAADDLKKAVDNWNIDTGTYILMGSATDRASYESDRFRHGLLTYALLHGMKGEALVDGTRLEAAHWFDTAIPAVEKYAAMIGRDQKPQKAVPSAAGGVPVGFFPEAVRAQIQLPDPAAEILKLTVCLDETTFTDSLQLAAKVRSELRALTSATARGPAVTYDDNNTEASSGALTPQVRYRTEGGQLKLTVSLLQADKPIASAALTAPAADLTAAARQIAQALLQLAAPPK